MLGHPVRPGRRTRDGKMVRTTSTRKRSVLFSLKRGLRVPRQIFCMARGTLYRLCADGIREVALSHPARSTVAAILVRVGLNRLAHLTPRGPVIRYERTRPGELVHLDIKPLARILRVGHRIHGDRRHIVEGAGYEYAHVAVDDYSRVAYVEVLPDQRGGTTAAFLRRTVGWFARRGVTVERVLTDNGSAYRSAVFAHVAHRTRVRLIRSRPRHPQTNGKAERFIQTLIRGWAYGVAYPSSWRRTLALRPWLRHYNVERPHAALAYQPPCVRLPRAAQ